MSHFLKSTHTALRVIVTLCLTADPGLENNVTVHNT